MIAKEVMPMNYIQRVYIRFETALWTDLLVGNNLGLEAENKALR